VPGHAANAAPVLGLYFQAEQAARSRRLNSSKGGEQFWIVREFVTQFMLVKDKASQ
jgi:hypothetical protein